MIDTPWAGFIADFPDDVVWGGPGQMEIAGGRNVAVALIEILAGLGCQASAPEYVGVKGWEFEIYYKEHRFWCQVTSFHPAFYLLFEDPAITRGTRAKNAAAYAEIWQKLADALDKDPRFQGIEWRSKADGPPEPEEIGDARVRDKIVAAHPEPLEPSLRPELRPKGATGFLALLFLAAIFGCVFGIATTIAGVIRLVVKGMDDGGSGIATSVGIFCLSALVLWALYREPKRGPKA